MYYPGVPGTAPAVAGSQEKGGNIYIPSQGSYTAHVAPGYPAAQPVLPNGLTAAARYAPAPQAYAMVSTPAGHPAYAPGLYSSMPYTGLARIPTSSHAYISAAQYPGGIGYQTTALAGRPAPPSQMPLPTPVQAGAPLFAAGYTQLPTGMAAPGARSLPLGPVPTAAAAYPPGYPFPGAAAASTEGTTPIAYAPGGYVPQF